MVNHRLTPFQWFLAALCSSAYQDYTKVVISFLNYLYSNIHNYLHNEIPNYLHSDIRNFLYTEIGNYQTRKIQVQSGAMHA